MSAAKAGEVFDLLEKFANYGFNKSHAAAYAVVSYQTAYLKANYPAEFMAAVMNCDLHQTDKLAVYATLYEVLEGVCRVMAPVLPFLTEEIEFGCVLPLDGFMSRDVPYGCDRGAMGVRQPRPKREGQGARGSRLRNSRGDMPVQRRKARMKALASA